MRSGEWIGQKSLWHEGRFIYIFKRCTHAYPTKNGFAERQKGFAERRTAGIFRQLYQNSGFDSDLRRRQAAPSLVVFAAKILLIKNREEQKQRWISISRNITETLKEWQLRARPNLSISRQFSDRPFTERSVVDMIRMFSEKTFSMFLFLISMRLSAERAR